MAAPAVSVGMPGGSAVTMAAPRVWAELSGESVGAAPVWSQRLDVVVESVRLTSGSEPAECILRIEAVPGGGQAQTSFEADLTEIPGEGAFAPRGVRHLNRVRVRMAAVDGRGVRAERTLFLGDVISWAWDLAFERFRVVCQDDRWRMSRMPLSGRWVSRPADGSSAFIRASDLVFNAGGMPDHRVGSGPGGAPERRYQFYPPEYNRQDASGDPSDSVSASGDHAGHWSPGDILGYLQRVYGNVQALGGSGTTITGFGASSYADFLHWPEVASPGQLSGLFESSDPDPRAGAVTRENALSDLNLTGVSLAEAIDVVVGAAGGFDWTLDYDDPAAGGRSALRFYSTTSGSGAVNVYRGALGAAVGDGRMNVIGGALESDVSDRYNRVFVLGGRRRIEATFSTEDGTLEAAWSASDEDAWTGLDRDDAKRYSIAYPEVFLRYEIPADLDWSTFFDNDAWSEEARPLLASLLSSDFDAAAANRHRVRRKLLVWRKKDATWELLPADITAHALAGRAGIQLGGNARNELASYGEGGVVQGPWTWDPDASGAPRGYPIRLTAVVEADERISAQVDTSRLSGTGDAPGAADGFASELLVHAGHEFRYEARRKAYVLDDSKTPQLIGGGAADVLRDDTPRLEAIAFRKHRKFSRTRIGGAVELSGIEPAYAVGNILARMTGGGGRTSPSLDTVIREVTYAFEDTMTTTLRVERTFR